MTGRNKYEKFFKKEYAVSKNHQKKIIKKKCIKLVSNNKKLNFINYFYAIEIY
jgi:hypothetical protein